MLMMFGVCSESNLLGVVWENARSGPEDAALQTLWKLLLREARATGQRWLVSVWLCVSRSVWKPNVFHRSALARES